MFVTKRWYFDFVTFFCQYQVCLKYQKLVYESFSVNENSFAKLKKSNINELAIAFVCKRWKRVPFLSIGSCIATRRNIRLDLRQILRNLHDSLYSIYFDQINSNI